MEALLRGENLTKHFGGLTAVDDVSIDISPGQVMGLVGDNGAGKFRGVYLQSNDAARPVFEAWLAPFADLGAGTISIRDTIETDHLAFDAVGLPGFQFMQDELEYESHTHHTNLDTVDHIVPGDLMQAAAILATIVYHTANRPELMPRKPLPEPLPEKQEVPDIIRY